MTIEQFNTIIRDQVNTCTETLTGKGHEYSPNTFLGTEETDGQLSFIQSSDRLAHFKKAAAIMSTTPKAALLGMLSKHLVSVSDMCVDGRKYPMERWNEKITDSINYLLILRAIVEEEQHE